jgi:hypothetical protein
VKSGRYAAGQLQHRGGFARDVLGVEDQEVAGVRRRAIDQGDEVIAVSVLAPSMSGAGNSRAKLPEADLDHQT